MAPLQRVWSYLRHGWMRESILLRLRRPAGLFQPFGFTTMNRHVPCFVFARETLGGDSELNLLSFGCSTGEEVFTLAEYFPHARIKGIDINPRAIRAAKARTPPAEAARIAFEVASSADAEPEGFYDAVFAFAVFQDSRLRHGPPRCDHLIRFADFERAITGLARCIRPGGLLFMRHAHFRFGDTAAAVDFDVAMSVEPNPAATPRPLYGRDDCLLRASPSKADAAWRKRI